MAEAIDFMAFDSLGQTCRGALRVQLRRRHEPVSTTDPMPAFCVISAQLSGGTSLSDEQVRVQELCWPMYRGDNELNGPSLVDWVNESVSRKLVASPSLASARYDGPTVPLLTLGLTCRIVSGR